MSNERTALPSASRMRRFLPRAGLLFALAFAFAMLAPVTAYAWPWDDAVNEITSLINDMVSGWLRDILQTILNWIVHFVQSMSVSDILLGDFNELLSGSLTGFSVYNLMHDIWSAVVKPLGHSILALVMLVQVVKISQKIDAQATLPTVKEILFLAAFFMIFTWLINNSFELCAAVFDAANGIGEAIYGKSQASSIGNITIPEDASIGFGTFVVAIFVFIIMLVGAFIGSVVAYVIAWARALQLYIMTAFSPIPFALLGFEETRSFGINFCKNFISVCLAGAIMIVLIIVYPILMAGCISNLTADSLVSLLGGNSFDATISIVQAVACTFMFIFAMVKSGAWARDIMGG